MTRINEDYERLCDSLEYFANLINGNWRVNVRGSMVEACVSVGDTTLISVYKRGYLQANIDILDEFERFINGVSNKKV